MGDAPEQQDIQQEEKPKSKLPFIIGGLLILLIGIVAVSMTLLGGEEGTETKPPVDEPGYMFEFPENFTVNLAHPDDQYIYNAKITLEIEPKGDKSETEALEEMGIQNPDSKKNKMPVIRQTIYEILSSQTRVQVTSKAGRDKIRSSIETQLNLKLKNAEIKEVYLTGLVP